MILFMIIMHANLHGSDVHADLQMDTNCQQVNQQATMKRLEHALCFSYFLAIMIWD